MSEERKVAIITGSSQGLGASIAIKLSQRNINLVINYSNNKDMALKIKDECVNNGVEAITVQADVSSDDDCKAHTVSDSMARNSGAASQWRMVNNTAG